LSKPTQAVFLETPSNPLLEVLDIRMIADLAHQAGARVVVDNVFATPILQKPLELGADIVVYSTTKHIDGQGRCLGGAVLCSQEFLDEYLLAFMRHTGPSMSPFNAWVMLKGLETLRLRVEAQSNAAHKIAEFLEQQPKVNAVRYPALPTHPQHQLAMQQMSMGSTLISFDYDGDKAQVFRFLNQLQVIDISNNLGDSKSLMNHPSTMTHQRLTEEIRLRLGILPNSVRLSVGLEDVQDLCDDLAQAMNH
nr:PLP-dependent transferase [Alphaproteobacteria bacterium]